MDAGQRPSHCNRSLLSCNCCSACAELTRLFNTARYFINPWPQAVVRRRSELRRCGGLFGRQWHQCRHPPSSWISTGTHSSLLLLFAARSLNYFLRTVHETSRLQQLLFPAVDCALIASVQDPLTQDLFVADYSNHNIRKYSRSTGMETANPRAFLNDTVLHLLKRFIVVKHVLPGRWSTVAGSYSQGNTSSGGLFTIETLMSRCSAVNSLFRASTVCVFNAEFADGQGTAAKFNNSIGRFYSNLSYNYVLPLCFDREYTQDNSRAGLLWHPTLGLLVAVREYRIIRSALPKQYD